MQVTGNNYKLNKSLSIRLCTDGFSFSAYSPNEPAGKRFVHISYTIDPDVSMAANLKAALGSIDLIHDRYHSVQVLIDSACCHVPFECFEEEEKELVFLCNFPNEKGKIVLYNILTQCNISVLFCIDKSVHQLLLDYFPDAHYYSVETPMLEHLAIKSKSRDSQKLFAVLQNHKLTVFVMNGGKLSFANYYFAADYNDFIYFILQVWKSLGLDQLKDEIHLVGEINKMESFVVELRRFIRQVYRVNPTAEFNRSEVATYPLLPYDLVTLLSGTL